MVGITSYGTYIPKLRIKVEDIASFWNKDAAEIQKHLGVFEKSVAAIDEDAATLATEAALLAINRRDLDPEDIGAILVGSESHPYSVKPTSTLVGSFLGLKGNFTALDTEFACKAATAAIILSVGLIEAKRIKNSLVIGSDTAQARPGDPLEYSSASAAAAFILGNRTPIAVLREFSSYTSDTPDFWRRDGQKYPSHGGRFTGEPAYFHHILSASEALFEKAKVKPEDFDYAVFHMPNSKFPREAARRLGFDHKQIADGFIVDKIGNPYSASSLAGLAAVLDIAKPSQKIFVCSYGSGAGSDAFIFETTKYLTAYQRSLRNKVADQIHQKQYTDYPHYLKITKARNYHL